MLRQTMFFRTFAVPMYFSNSIKRGIQVALTLVFMAHFSVNTLFVHTHYYEGQKVVHSHPYASGEKHQHSQQSLVWSLLHSFLLGLLVALPLLRPLSASRLQRGVACISRVLSISNDQVPVRGPPAF